MERIDLVYFDAGGGHRSAANALCEAIRQQGRSWELRMVNLQEVLDELDPFRRLAKVRAQDIYNTMLREGWTLGSPQLKSVYHGLIRISHSNQVRILERFWSQARPDLVVSLIPHFNRALAESLERVHPKSPFVTVLTDIVDCPPHFWIERQKQHLICGHPAAVEQARAIGHPQSRIWQTSGMIVHPNFYRPIPMDRAEGLRRLQLDPAIPTGLVLFGGHGSRHMLKIARRLAGIEEKLQLIMICGRNEELAAELRALDPRLPMFVEGFTQEVPYYMKLSDFFIGKPGPGSLSEAVLMGLPVIVERNVWTMPQERYNTEWVRNERIGLVLDNFSQIREAVRSILEPAAYGEFKRRVGAQTIRAVFEIPDILGSILREPALADSPAVRCA